MRPCKCQGHCLFFMDSRVLPCGSAAAQYVNPNPPHALRLFSPPNMGKVISRMWLCLTSTSCVPCVFLVFCSANSLVFNGLYIALEPNHIPQQGLWWEVTPLGMLFNRNKNQRVNRLVGGRRFSFCVIYKVCGPATAIRDLVPACAFLSAVNHYRYYLCVSLSVDCANLWSSGASLVVPLWAGEHLWETDKETCSDHSPAHPVSVSLL